MSALRRSLRRSSNKGLVEVTGDKVNCGAHWKYHASTILGGSEMYIERLKTIIENQD